VGDRGMNAPIGPGLAAIGGVVLAIGSVMTWAKASIDLNAFATALGIDPAQIPASAAAQTTKTFAGTNSTDGKIALACGIVAIVLGLAAYARREMSKPLGGLAIVAGLVGGGYALYDITQKSSVVADAKTAAGPSLTAAGIDPGILDKIFKVDLGIGIWLCVAGGALVVIGGVMLLMRGSAATPAIAGMPSGFAAPSDSGFGAPAAPAAPSTPTPASTTPTPASTMPTPAPTMPTPASTMPTPAPTMPTPAPTMPTPAPTMPTPVVSEPAPPETEPDSGGTGASSSEDTGGDGSTTS